MLTINLFDHSNNNVSNIEVDSSFKLKDVEIDFNIQTFNIKKLVINYNEGNYTLPTLSPQHKLFIDGGYTFEEMSVYLDHVQG